MTVLVGLHACATDSSGLVNVSASGSGTDASGTAIGSGDDSIDSGLGSETEGDGFGTSGAGTGYGSEDAGTEGCVVEVCDGEDNDCDGDIDEGCDCLDGDSESCFTNEERLEGVGECVAGVRECVDGAWGTCQEEVGPAREQCNSLDDDCDGIVDEDFGEVTCGEGICMVTVEVCVEGVRQACTPGAPQEEECNGFDDDCDGRVDEIMCECLNGEEQDCYTGPMGTEGVGSCMMGTQQCIDGVWGACTGDQTPLPEVCDGIDNDCDGMVDDGDPDGGGSCITGLSGLCSEGTEACIDGGIECEQTTVAEPEICDGFDNNCNGLVDEALGDTTCGVGVCNHTSPNCLGGVEQVCDPFEGASAEICDGLDNDCDGSIDEGNPGGGAGCNTGLLGVCLAGIWECSGGGLVCDPLEGAVAEVCDGLDNDCDGSTDESLGNTTCGEGACNHTVPNCDGGMPQVCNPFEGASAESCDGLDNDCDGVTDESLGNTTCGMGVCSHTEPNCVGGVTQVCDPFEGASAEVCDGLDNDCDGGTDEGNPGGGGGCNTGLLGACSAGTWECSGGSLSCDQNVAASPEVCDGNDNDCDGSTDEGNPGGGGGCNTGLLGVCAAGTSQCSGGALSCDQNVAASAEVCDGNDNDCDGSTDEGNPGGGGGCVTGLSGVCSAGTWECTGGSLNCDQNVAASAEVCDGLDNDCDGIVDEGNPGGGGACNTGLLGVCSEGTWQCSGGGLSCDQNVAASAEVCDGDDNDCDGLTDEGNPGGGIDCGICGTTVCAVGMLYCLEEVVCP